MFVLLCLVRVVCLNRAIMSSAETSGTCGMSVSMTDTVTVVGATGATGCATGAPPAAGAIRAAFRAARACSVMVLFAVVL